MAARTSQGGTMNRQLQDLSSLVGRIAEQQAAQQTAIDTLVRNQDKMEQAIAASNNSFDKSTVITIAGAVCVFCVLLITPTMNAIINVADTQSNIRDLLTDRAEYMGYSTAQIQRNKDDAEGLATRININENKVAAGLEADAAMRVRISQLETRYGAAELRLSNLGADVAQAGGRFEALSRWVQDVDTYGSRKWTAPALSGEER